MKNMIYTELNCDELSLISGGINQRKVIVTLSEIAGTLLGSILIFTTLLAILNFLPDITTIKNNHMQKFANVMCFTACVSVITGGCFGGYRLGKFVGNKIANKVLAKKVNIQKSTHTKGLLKN